MSNVVTESTVGKTLYSATITSLTGNYTFGSAVRVKSVMITGTAGDVIALSEYITGTGDPINYLTLPNATSGFFWDTGDYKVTPAIVYAACTVSDWSKVKITFHIRS